MNRELTLEIVKEFFKDKPLIERAYLFGSFERREETENSDLDLLVDMKETINLLRFIQIKQDLENKIGRKVDLLTRDSISSNILPLISKNMELIYERKG